MPTKVKASLQLKPEQQVRLNAFRQHLAAHGEFVLLNGRKIEALVSEVGTDEAFISGGIAQAGGFHCQIAAADVADMPEKFTPIKVRGLSLQVLERTDVNGVTYDLTAGDPASEVQ